VAIGVNWAEIWAPVWKDVWTQTPPVEVPDVVGETQAAGTTTLEGVGFVVSVSTEYSASVAVGLIISQSPEGGEFAASGSTVAIVVSLGLEPEAEPVGGHYWPDERKRKKPKDYRAELDEKRLKERAELRRLIESAAGLIDEALEEHQPAVERQATALNVELGKLREYAEELGRDPERELHAIQERVDAVLARAQDELIVQVTQALTDLIQEMAEDELGSLMDDLMDEIAEDSAS
jgi:hypothetical protein